MADGTDWTTVLVAAITGSTALVGAALSLFLHFSEGRRARKSVRAALLAEVAALAYLIRERQYVDDLVTDLRDLQLRLSCASPFGEAEVQSLEASVAIPDTYNLIYRENIGKLGVLKPKEAERVVLFYQLLQSVIVDVSPGGYLAQGTRDANSVLFTIKTLNEALELASQLRQRKSLWTFCGRRKDVKAAD